MPHISWSDPVSRDIIQLYDSLAMKSQYTAFRAQETIRQEVKILAKHPQLGRLIDDLPSEFRELVITFGQGAYIARYRLNPDSIVILALRNAREAGY